MEKRIRPASKILTRESNKIGLPDSWKADFKKLIEFKSNAAVMGFVKY